MNKNIVVIPFNLPWHWSTDYTNQTAFELAKKGNIVICYLLSDAVYIKETIFSGKFPKFIQRYSKGIYLITPWYSIPFIRFVFIRSINSLINVVFLKIFSEIVKIVHGCKSAYFWVFDPNNVLIYGIFKKGYSLIYDCVDYFPGAVAPESKEGTIKNERRLLEMADLVVANSTVLRKHLLKYRKDIKLVPQGFRLDTFNKSIEKANTIKNGNRPLIGFVGAVNHRIDYKLLFILAKSNLNWDFAIWGKLLEKDLFTPQKEKYYKKLISLPNVITGQSEKKEIPSIIKQFDIGVIPYDMSMDFNKYCYPMKVFEYFYLGKPIVSSDVIELRRFPGTIKIGKNCDEWQKNIKEILSTPWSKKLVQQEKKLAQQNSWSMKVEKILSFLS